MPFQISAAPKVTAAEPPAQIAAVPDPGLGAQIERALHADPALAARMTATLDPNARLCELLIACGAADAERLAIMLTAMVDGLWLELSLDAESFGAEAAVQMVERAVEALLL